MRDIERIEPFMNELAQIWGGNRPDMRFCQFIMNVIGEISIMHGDPFFLKKILL